MPTYENKCDACGFKFEKFQPITSKAIKKCPHCGKNRAKRLIGTGAGLIFKGGGFYITDYRSESYKSGAKAAESASGSASAPAKEGSSSTGTGGGTSGESGSKGSDSKPAAEAKPAAKPAETKASSTSSKGSK